MSVCLSIPSKNTITFEDICGAKPNLVNIFNT